MQIKLGGILADDMGLGKTLQTLTWLGVAQGAAITKNPKPSLVICPASVLHNWRREAEKFTPNLKVLVLESGAARHNLRKQIPQNDIIVTNYALLRRDLEELNFTICSFRAVILDEAQFIKNPGAQVTQSVKLLKSRKQASRSPARRWKTGCWICGASWILCSRAISAHRNIFSTLTNPRAVKMPKVRTAHRPQTAFGKIASAPIAPLEESTSRKICPTASRNDCDCPLGDEQRKLYLAELRRSRDQSHDRRAETQGLNKSEDARPRRAHAVAAGLLSSVARRQRHRKSGKTETLFELLDPLIADGQKVLVFSQFVQMLQLLEKECRGAQHPHAHAHRPDEGSSGGRERISRPTTGAGVFLLSLRAAGTGLNLTNASYVVLYDPWWNPAVEAQAIDRSHRIGQTQTVNAYRLIAPGTVEEKIWELQQSKAQTIADVLGEEGFARSLTAVDLEYLFSED